MPDNSAVALEALKKLLIQANQEIVRREDQLHKLSKELQKLKKLQLENKSENERKKDPDPVVIVNDGDGAGGEDERRARAEEVDVILIFPEEIWDKILGMLTDPKDLYNCSKACGLFQKLVNPTKTTWLFHKVFPHAYLYLEGHSILNCRQVCKTWNEGVDTVLENHRSLRPQSDSSTSGDPIRPYLTTLPRPKFFGGGYLFCNNNNNNHESRNIVHYFEIEMRDHPRNPFIGRAVTISEYRYGEQTRAEYWENVYRFMEHFGKHIWYLTLNLFVHNPTAWTIQKVFEFLTVELQQFAPDLRRLRLCGHLGKYQYRLEEPELTSASGLTKLETLEIDDAIYQEPSILVNRLLNGHSATLKSLHVKATTWNNVGKNLEKWENLTELHVEDLAAIEDFDTLFQMNTLNLRKLGLSLASSTQDWTFPKILEVLERVSKISPLHTLRFSGNIPMKFFERLESDLYVPPSLKTLELEHCGEDVNSLTCYTFLARFPFLETLNLFWRRGENWDRTVTEMKCRSEIVFRPPAQFKQDPYKKFCAVGGGKEVVEVYKIMYGSLGDVYKSNVWEMLPRLKVLTFQGRVYTREGYEHAKTNIAKAGKSGKGNVSDANPNGTTSGMGGVPPPPPPHQRQVNRFSERFPFLRDEDNDMVEIPPPPLPPAHWFQNLPNHAPSPSSVSSKKPIG